MVTPHRHAGVFIARGKEDALVTRNLVPGVSVYGEKRISVEVQRHFPFSCLFFQFFSSLDGRQGQNRVSRLEPVSLEVGCCDLGWFGGNSHCSRKQGIVHWRCVGNLGVSRLRSHRPGIFFSFFFSFFFGSRFLFRFWQEGVVYAVEFSHRSGRDLINMAKKRTNVVPIVEDARHPLKYRMLIGTVDTVFADVAQPDQVSPLVHLVISGSSITVSFLVGSYRGL